MILNLKENITKWQNDLNKNAYIIVPVKLSEAISTYIRQENYQEIDKYFTQILRPQNELFTSLSAFCAVEKIEHIISLRESKNAWEEDGIWHDDGSRVLAFSLSLTLEKPKGGVLEIRKKGHELSTKLSTPGYGNMIIFKTGVEGYEHKINKVTKGKRLIIAGWCYDSSSV